ncbi:hypothetical protein ACHAXT_002117 [Thalassiosira profunda]
MNLPRLLTALLAFGSTVVPAESIDFVQVKERLLRSRSLKTPDGETPATETVCAMYEGEAYGICNAFCEAKDCIYSPLEIKSCDKLREKWEDLTDGGRLPCAPTMSPTASPTMSPTKSPTKSPSASPTESPTKSPTAAPTTSPTESPTANPTESPIPQAAPGFYPCPTDPGVAFTSLASDGGAVELATVSDCNDCEETVILPDDFTFNWFGVDLTAVDVGSDGYILIPEFDGYIYILASDLIPETSTGGIYTKANDGSFTISVEGVGFFDGYVNPGESPLVPKTAVGKVNAQATLFEDGRIFMCFDDSTGSIQLQCPGCSIPFSGLDDNNPQDCTVDYPNPLLDADGHAYFDANGFWVGDAGTHPDGCACFYPDTPTYCGGVVYDPATQGCCGGDEVYPFFVPEVYTLATEGCCFLDVYNLASEGCCRGDEVYTFATELCCDSIGPYTFAEQGCCFFGLYTLATQDCCDDFVVEGTCPVR